MDKALLRDVVNSGLKNEFFNAKVAQQNLARARNLLKKELDKNPGLLYSRQFESVLDGYIDEINNNLVKQLEIGNTLSEGAREGKFIVGSEAGVPKDSSFWGWQPSIPINAIQLAESEMADLIQKTTKELQTKILRAVQSGLALGMDSADIADEILGVGLKGLKGKDGIWRSATLRAEMQARTVSNDLINRGAMMTYKQVDSEVPELKLVKIWQTVSDRRTSKRCSFLNGQIKELDESFVADDGWSGMQPPSHPHCRSRVTTISGKYKKEYDKRFATVQTEESPKPAKAKRSKTTKKKAKPTVVTPQPKLTDNDIVFSNPNYSLDGFNDAIGDLAKQDPVIGAKLNDMLEFQKKNKVNLFLHDDKHKRGQKKRFENHLTRQFERREYGSVLGPQSFKKDLTISGGEWGFTGKNLPYIMLRTDRLNNAPLQFDLGKIKDNYKEVSSKHAKAKLVKNKIKYKENISPNSTIRSMIDGSYDEQTLFINTYAHELGHQVQYKSAAYVIPEGLDFTDFPTKYSFENVKELFAESFAQYVFDPEGLRQNSPKLYDWVDTAWRKVR